MKQQGSSDEQVLDMLCQKFPNNKTLNAQRGKPAQEVISVAQNFAGNVQF